jgi:alpha-L-fucosidase 2
LPSTKKIELGHNYVIPIRLTTTDSRYPVNSSYSLVYFVIEARYPPFPNLSLNMPVSQSTTGYDGDASRAVDGNTSGAWGNNSVTHTEEGLNTQAWWQVDIGSVNNIYQVDIYNRTDCCGDRLTNYHIFVSEEPFTGTTVAETQAQAGVKDFFQKATASTPSSLGINTRGRYVRIQLDATNTPLSLAEVQVRGEP